MSFSFVVVDKNNSVNVVSLDEYLKQNFVDYEILYCSTKAIQMQSIQNYVINKNDDTESIINSVLCNATKKNIVVMRQIVSNEKLKTIVDNIKTPDSIVYFKKENKGIKKFFCNTLKKLAKILYSTEITFANHAVIAYGENISTVLKELEYPSNAMRKFSWIGVKHETLDSNEIPYKLNYKRTSIALKTFLPLLLSIVLLVIYALFRIKIPMLWEVIMLLTILVGLVLFAIYCTNWFIKSQIGENTNTKINFKKGE